MPPETVTADRWIVLGRIVGLHGVSGWVKVFSHTQPRDGLFAYHPLYLKRDDEWQPLQVEAMRVQGKGLIAKWSGCDDRDAAAALMRCELGIRREQLPPLAPGEYYWSDLIGLRVVNQDGVDFGTVAYLLETGANDVLVVQGERERLLPFIQGAVILTVDLAQGFTQVAWDADF